MDPIYPFLVVVTNDKQFQFIDRTTNCHILWNNQDTGNIFTSKHE